MRSFLPIIALAAAATATNMGAMDDAQSCAMKTLLSSNACNTGDAACLCSDSTRQAVMEEIKTACGADQADQTDKLASDACSMQKARRAFMPSASVVHMGLATPSASSDTARMNGAEQQGSTCSCANNQTPQVEDPEDSESSNKMNDNQSPSRVHAPSMMVTHGAATSSAAVRQHGAMTTPSSSARVAHPSGADAFSTFKGAGAHMLPSLGLVAGGVLAGVVGVFAAL